MGFLLGSLRVVALFADYELYGRSGKAEGVAQTVFDISLVGEVEQFGAVAEDDKCRRCDRGLRHVVNAQSLALVRGRLNARHSLAQYVVQHSGGYAHDGR